MFDDRVHQSLLESSSLGAAGCGLWFSFSPAWSPRHRSHHPINLCRTKHQFNLPDAAIIQSYSLAPCNFCQPLWITLTQDSPSHVLWDCTENIPDSTDLGLWLVFAFWVCNRSTEHLHHFHLNNQLFFFIEHNHYLLENTTIIKSNCLLFDFFRGEQKCIIIKMTLCQTVCRRGCPNTMTQKGTSQL